MLNQNPILPEIDTVKTTVRKGYKYLIKKGKHSSIRFKQKTNLNWKRVLFSWLPFCITKGRFRKLRAVIQFENDNWHTIPEIDNNDWYDINKVIGLSFGLARSAHQDSFRIGYIYDYTNPGYVNLYAYSYNKGKRSYTPVDTPLGAVRVGEDFELTIMQTDYNTMYVNVYQNGDIVDTDSIPFVNPHRRYFSVMEPYHGGQEKAPNNQIFFLKQLTLQYH